MTPLLAALALAAASPADARPNVLVLFTDDQGVGDVGRYGSEIPTPHIDALGRDGLTFSQFYAASSICTPSRFGLLTGRAAHRSADELTGALMFLDARDARRGIRPHEPTFAESLRQAGYATHLVGKWHLGHGDKDLFWPTRHGFETFFGHTGGCVDFFTCRYGNVPDWYRGDELIDVPADAYATRLIAEEAVAIVERAAEGGGGRPWYLQVSFNAPHFAKGFDWASGEPANVMQPAPADLAAADRVDAIASPLRRAFAAKVIGADRAVGRILDALEATGQADDTLVIFMTDHGGDPAYGGSNAPLRAGKATLYEGGVRVPCLVRWPGVTPAGATTDAVASALDWFPTFAAAGLCDPPPPVRAAWDGQSILPVLKGEPAAPHRPIVWKTGPSEALSRSAWSAVRAGDWKWVRPPGGPGDPAGSASDGGELYDLAADPAETTDRAAEFPETAARLAALADGAE